MWRLLAIIAVTLGLAAGIYFWPHAKPAPVTAPHAGWKPQRIVCLAPSITETVFALGAGDRVVGVTKWCDYPPEARTRTVVGGMGLPNLEILASLHPDLILAPSFGKTEDYERLRQLGYRVEVSKEATSFEDVLNGIGEVGLATRENSAALLLRLKLDAELRRVRDLELARVQTCIPVPDEMVAFVVGHDPLFVAGSDTFADDLLHRANALNVCGDVKGWSPYSMENLLVTYPQVILDSTGGQTEVREYWKRWPTLPAVQSGRVYAVDPNLTNRPGPRIVEGFEQIARLFHPEAFAKPEGGK